MFAGVLHSIYMGTLHFGPEFLVQLVEIVMEHTDTVFWNKETTFRTTPFLLTLFINGLFFICLFACLHVFILFAEEDGPELPTKADQEFRPFIRRLPEFKFW